MPGGALPVPFGDTIVELAEDLAKKFNKQNNIVVVTQDYHPLNHCSFDCNGGPWPMHCVAGIPESNGVNIVGFYNESLRIKKGQDPNVDSYSAFFDNDHKTGTGLLEYLKEKGVEAVYVCGLAYDYCVKFTAIDARNEGFETFVITDACKGVGGADGIKQAEWDMLELGIELIRSDEIERGE
jgi:nicotinamidase/pyrazinamidase